MQRSEGEIQTEGEDNPQSSPTNPRKKLTRGNSAKSVVKRKIPLIRKHVTAILVSKSSSSSTSDTTVSTSYSQMPSTGSSRSCCTLKEKLSRRQSPEVASDDWSVKSCPLEALKKRGKLLEKSSSDRALKQTTGLIKCNAAGVRGILQKPTSTKPEEAFCGKDITDDACKQIFLGEQHLRHGQHEEAEECFGNALNIRRRSKGRYSLEVVQVYEKLGDTAQRHEALKSRVQWRYDAALSILDRMKETNADSKKVENQSALEEMEVYRCRILLKKSRTFLASIGSTDAAEGVRNFLEAMKSPALPSKRKKSAVEDDENSSRCLEKITDVLTQVGDLLMEIGDYDKALLAYLEVYNATTPFPACAKAPDPSLNQPRDGKLTCKKLYPIRPLIKEDAKVVEVLKRIAEIHDIKQQYEESVKWYNAAMDLMTDDMMLQFFSYKDAFILCGIATDVVKKMGDFNKVIEWYQEGIDISEKELGPTHDVVATVYNKFGNEYRAAGMYEEAVECFKKEGKIRVAKNDNDDDTKHTAAVLVRIASTYCSWGKSEKALVYYRDAIDSLIPVKYRGRKTSNQDWLSEKLEHVEEALAGLPDDNDEDFISGHTLTKNDVAKFLNDMGNLFHMKASYNSAVTCYQKSSSMRLVRNDGDRQDILRINFNIAKARLGAGYIEEALAMLTETLREQKKLLNAPNMDVANTLHEIGIIQMRSDAFNEAIGYFESSLSLKERLLGKNHQDVFGTRYNIAFALFKMGQIERAIPEFEDILRLQVGNLGEMHLETAKTQCMLGTVNASLRRYVDALQCFEQALQARKAELGDDDILVGKTYASIAAVNMAIGNYHEAHALSADALAVYQKAKLKRNHPYFLEAKRMMKKLDDYGKMSVPLSAPKAAANNELCERFFSLLAF